MRVAKNVELDCLAGDRAGVEAHVESIRLVSLFDVGSHLIDKGHEVGAFFCCLCPPVTDLASRHDERMSRIDGIGVPHCQRGPVRCDPICPRDVEERDSADVIANVHFLLCYLLA